LTERACPLIAPPQHEEFDRVVTIAELFLNHLEHIAVLGDAFGKENRPALDRFCRLALGRSPILRQHLARNPASYSDSLTAFLPRALAEREADPSAPRG
jgi:hypothetical protein